MRGRLWAIVPATIAVALFGAAPASAFWAEGGGYRSGAFGTVEVHGVPGEAADLTVRQFAASLTNPSAPGKVIVHDDVASVTPPPAGHGQGCAQVDDHTLSCTGVGLGGEPISVDYLWVGLGDEADRVNVPATSLPMWVFGSTGGGDDRVVLRDLDGSSVYLGDGNDRLVLRGSQSGPVFPESVNGGAGDDVLDVRNGNDDAPRCDAGVDVLYADPGETGTDCETRVAPL
ncbi:MAG: hypothetical protein ACJ760_01185 [Thermoleophilaceae bacterium]